MSRKHVRSHFPLFCFKKAYFLWNLTSFPLQAVPSLKVQAMLLPPHGRWFWNTWMSKTPHISKNNAMPYSPGIPHSPPVFCSRLRIVYCFLCKDIYHCWRCKWPWCWETLRVGGEEDNRRWDGWMASPTQWTWVWVDPGIWWWTGRPGMLWFMGLQVVGHNWVTELNSCLPFTDEETEA